MQGYAQQRAYDAQSIEAADFPYLRCIEKSRMKRSRRRLQSANALSSSRKPEEPKLTSMSESMFFYTQ
jgi:hypothetical protein